MTTDFFPEMIQKHTIDILDVFRNQYLCEYAVIIENLEYKIEEVSKRSNKMDLAEFPEGKNLLEKFKMILENFCQEQLINIKHIFPENWISFFKLFKIPISTDSMKITDFHYKNGFFYGECDVVYGYHIEKRNLRDNERLIQYLLNLGYSKYETDREIIIGHKFTYNLAFTIEEQLTFHVKYLLAYNLHILWANICEFYQQNGSTEMPDNLNRSILNKDQVYPNIFKKVIKALFQVDFLNFPRTFRFKYSIPDLEKDTLDLIYNKYMFADIKKIEKRARSYVKIRSILSKMGTKWE